MRTGVPTMRRTAQIALDLPDRGRRLRGARPQPRLVRRQRAGHRVRVDRGQLHNRGGPGTVTWGNQPSSGSYTPSLPYQRSTAVSHSGTVTITSPAVGTYDVFLPFQNEGLDGGHVQVTAYGAGTNRCQVGFWGGASGGRSVRVYCFTNAGALVDTFFTMQYTAKVQ